MVSASERITSSVRQVWIAKAGSTFRAWKPARRKTPPRGATGALATIPGRKTETEILQEKVT
jgi:hypothetical protein